MKEKKIVLFVDDELNVLNAIERIVRRRRQPWDMICVQSADEAVTVLNNKQIEAVVTDISMPGKDGFELLESIRSSEQTKDIPVVILTGNDQSGIKKKALEMGANDFLSKPADNDELVARINNMLKLKAYQDEIMAHNEYLEQTVKKRTAEIDATRIDLIWRLSKTAEYRDTDTGNHVIRVGYYSYILAESVGMDKKLCEMIFFTAPLHDIGKIAIPDSILLKPGKLTKEEFETMKHHSAIGSNILMEENAHMKGFAIAGSFFEYFKDSLKSENPFLAMASNVAHYHHERWSGNGYPNGLKGKEIPVESRIASLADVYDALNSKRPYKEGFADEKVMAIMRDQNGDHFDPEIFNAFENNLHVFRDIRDRLSNETEEASLIEVIGASFKN